MPGEQLFTSESVTEGHPDKMADQISDAVLDAHLAQDKNARVACETLLKTSLVVLAGEVRSTAQVDAVALAKKTIRDIGYDDDALGFVLDEARIIDAVEAQSPDIAQGVDEAQGHEQGAGDQGMMFGYACDETPELMPAPIMWSHHVARALSHARKSGAAEGLWPDGKVQVTVRYRGERPVGIDTLLISTQHKEDVLPKRLEEMLRELVVDPCLRRFSVGEPGRDVRPPKLGRLLVNPTGRFVIGGPKSDAGLTGRKIIVDTYGGMGRHGGGAFSGKDPSKVDRSAAYFARYIAKNIVAARLASRCEVQLAYAIGVAKPVSLRVDTFGTGTCEASRIEAAAAQLFDARPRQLIDRLDLQKPRYQPTASYGHFGRPSAHAPWEQLDAVDALQQACAPAATRGATASGTNR